VIHKHLQELSKNKDYQEIYRLMSEGIKNDSN